MPISQSGALNTTSLVVPDLYVQIVPPQNLVLNGVPTNVLGVVGTAQWGPVNQPVIVGSMAAYATQFGAIQARKYDMGTHVATAVQQGASNFRCVRVTDGSDTAATAAIGSLLTFAATISVPQSGSGSYAPADTITLAGGTFTTATVLTVASTQVQSANINAAGTGGTTGVQTVTGTTGTGTKFTASVTVAGGAITAINSITTGGAYTVNPTSLTAEPVTGGGLTGATLGLKMGVLTTTISTPGSYTVYPTNPVAQNTTSGSGTGAQFNLTSGGNITFTALYTGSLGNSLVCSISAGSKASSWRLTIGLPGQQPEVYDNITGSGNAFWVALAAAINAGNGIQRPPSGLITATAGAGTATPSAQSVAFAGGTDGVATPATVLTNMTGADTTPRTGMYALRSQGCSIAVLADYDTSTNWTVAMAFGLSEGIYMILCGPSGDTIANAVATKASAGIDSYAVKMMFGDWIYWTDAANGSLRLVSPQGFVAGRLANLSPEQSSLNKPLYGVVDSQKSGLNPLTSTAYSAAELQTLFQAGIDVISNPQPAGSFWGCRLGHNSSSNPATNGDNYTRMTNYIASTLNTGMGQYVGQVVNATLFNKIKGTLSSFLQNLLGQGLLGSTDGSLPFGVICDTSNNPQSRTSLGYVQADVQVQYQAINEKFLVNVEGGTTVVVKRQTTNSGQIAA